jgi:Rrf2 family protein
MTPLGLPIGDQTGQLYGFKKNPGDQSLANMKLSRRGEYATKALLYLGACDQEQGVSASEIAKRAQIPEPFLNQIMLTLKNGGVLRSRRGSRGGYVLNRPPEQITIGEVARLMDGPLAPIPCASVTAYEPCPSCPEPEACRLRLLMREVRDAISNILDNTSLADLIRKTSTSSAPI